jgi:hypothetical protein
VLLSVAFGQSSPSKLPKIVVESGLEHSDHQTTSEELSKKVKSFECGPNAPNASRWFNSPRSVAESVGEKINTIRVVGFAPQFSNQKFSELRKTVLSVWNGKFQSSTCYINWAEWHAWPIETRLEFEDGRRGVLITDGSHVALKDHDGATWFFRLLPAAQ